MDKSTLYRLRDGSCFEIKDSSNPSIIRKWADIEHQYNFHSKRLGTTVSKSFPRMIYLQRFENDDRNTSRVSKYKWTLFCDFKNKCTISVNRLLFSKCSKKAQIFTAAAS